MITIYIFVCLLFISHQQLMLRNIKYVMKDEGVHTYIVHMSGYVEGNELIFSFFSNSASSFIITNLNSSKSESGPITGTIEKKFTKDNDFFCTYCDYNITITKENNLSSTVISYTETFPPHYTILSDNELYSVNSTGSSLYYFTYHTPSRDINPVSKILFEFSSHSPLTTIQSFISTINFPDPNNDKSYFWKTTESTLVIVDTEINFCKDTYCVYFLTIQPNPDVSFTVLPSCSFEYLEIPTDDHSETADIPPMSSSYGKIYLPNSEVENYNLEISFYFRKPPEFQQYPTKVALFVSVNPNINPVTTLWYAHTDVGSDGFLRISNNDPFFCMDCTYYLRLDVVPDVYFLLDTRIHTFISSEFAPIFIQSEMVARGFLRSKKQVLNYQFRIPEDYPDDYADTMLIKVVQDIFVEQNITAVVTNNHPQYPNPRCKTKTNWTIDFDSTDTGVFYIIRDMDGFCDNSSYILSITLNSEENRIQNFNLYSYLNMQMILLKNDVQRTDYITPKSPGIYYFINGTEFDMDCDIQIRTVSKCTSQLFVHISTSSFRDGNSSYELGENFTKTSLLDINNGAKYFLIAHNFYINVGFVEQTETSSCPIDITMKYQHLTEYPIPPFHSDPLEFEHKSGRDGYSYATMATQYYHNIKSVTFTFKYSGTGKPKSIYFKKNGTPKPRLGDYQQQVAIEDNPTTIKYAKYTALFCDDCTYHFTIEFPSDFNGRYSFYGEIESDPLQLNYTDIHTDRIEPNSPPDFYYLQLAKNTNNPSFIISLQFSTYRLPEMFLAVSSDSNNKRPGPDNANWYNSSSDSEMSILIDSRNPQYCTDCDYYIGIGTVGSTGDFETSYEIKIDCISGGCVTCNWGFSMESNCTECKKGFYGRYCRSCYCNDSPCDDGTEGSGNCLCDVGFTGSYCDQCSDGYYGTSCKLCTVDCHGNGKCDSGMYRPGTCKCQAAYSPQTNCSDCNYGYYDHDCSNVCPGAPEATCSYHGICNSGLKGNGRCQCDENYSGINCNTSIYLTTCKPSCDPIHGSCNEDLGLCHCYDGYTGLLCSIPPDPPHPSKQSSVLSGGVIALIVIFAVALVAIIGGLIYYFKKKIPAQLNRRARYTPK